MKKLNFTIYKNKKINFKKNQQIISIVTVVKNAEKSLQATLKNIFDQKYKNLEIIVVYTPSKDKTWEVIKKNKNKIHKIIINPELGIYKSMNIGILNCQGDYINFMNSGDFFYSKNTISSIFKKKQTYDVIYGDCKILYPKFLRYIKSGILPDIKNGMFFSHQSCFVKVLLHKKILFDTKYIFSADYDFFYKLARLKKSFQYCKKTISIRSSGGFSDTNRVLTLRDNYRINNIYSKDKFLNTVKYILITSYYTLLLTTRYFISTKIYNFFIKIIKK